MKSSDFISNKTEKARIEKRLAELNRKLTLVSVEMDVYIATIEGFLTYLNAYDEKLTFESRVALEDEELLYKAKLSGLARYKESYMKSIEQLEHDLKQIRTSSSNK